jgi:hypothetical protein
MVIYFLWFGETPLLFKANLRERTKGGLAEMLVILPQMLHGTGVLK